MIALEPWEIAHCQSEAYIERIGRKLSHPQPTALIAKLYYIRYERDPNDPRFWKESAKDVGSLVQSDSLAT